MALNIPEKLSECAAGCGAQVVIKTRPDVLCGGCRIERKRQRARATAERVRRAKGIDPIKGTEIDCGRCEARIVRSGLKRKWCDDCARAVSLERARAASAARVGDPEALECQRRWFREKRRRDPSFGISAHMKTMMHRALGGKKEGRSWRTFVDYSLDDLMGHLERQFLPGMTWENRGKWHIDHIVPQSSFTYTSPEDPEFKACWALTNLRPLWARDNIRKNAKRTFLI